MDETRTITIKHDIGPQVPARICMVCDALEIPGAAIGTYSGWICPECRRRIRLVIYPERYRADPPEAQRVPDRMIEAARNGEVYL